MLYNANMYIATPFSLTVQTLHTALVCALISERHFWDCFHSNWLFPFLDYISTMDFSHHMCIIRVFYRISFFLSYLICFTIYEYRSGKPKLCYTVSYSSCTIFITHCKAERFAITMNAKLSLSLVSCFGIRRLWGICFDFTPNTEYRYYILHS